MFSTRMGGGGGISIPNIFKVQFLCVLMRKFLFNPPPHLALLEKNMLGPKIDIHMECSSKIDYMRCIYDLN